MSEGNDTRTENEKIRFEIGPDSETGRLDKVIGTVSEDLSRARLEALIAEKQVTLNGKICTQPSVKIKVGDVVEVTLPPAVSALPEPENIPLDILYEDEHLIVINKQAGLVVHPGAGNYSGTLVNALLYHCADSLSGIGGVMRPGIVHRLDKDTSGVMLAAKTDQAHQGLAAQLEDRSLSRVYKALVLGVPQPRKGSVDQPLARDHRNRLKMAVNTRSGKAAKTHYQVITDYRGALCLLECKLESGRTHQIRVHMAYIGFPLIGDPLYGPQRTAVTAALKRGGYEPEVAAEIVTFPRQALHAAAISFIHPVSGEEMAFDAPMPDDFARLIEVLRG